MAIVFSAQAVSVENTQLATLAVQTSEKENINRIKGESQLLKYG